MTEDVLEGDKSILSGLVLNFLQHRREPHIPKPHLHAQRGTMREAIRGAGIEGKPKLGGWDAALARRTYQQANCIVAVFDSNSIECRALRRAGVPTVGQ